MNHRIKEYVFACVIIAIPVLLFFYRFLFPSPQIIITPDFGQSDAVASFSYKYILSEALKGGSISLWTSKLGGGLPIYATGLTGFWYVPNLIFFSIFSFEYAYLFSIVFSILLLGWGMYYWLRYLKISSIASLFGAITISLSGYTIVQLTHFTIIQSISLFPFIALTTAYLVERKSFSPVLVYAVLVSQLIFIGFPQSIVITLLFSTAYYFWGKSKNSSFWQAIMRFVIANSLAVLLSAVIIYPMYEYSKMLLSDGVFSTTGATAFSYPLKHLAALIHPYIFGNPALGTYPDFFSFDGSIFWENTNYIGIIPLVGLIAAASVMLLTGLRKKKFTINIEPTFVFMCVVLFVSFLLMLGKHSPLYFVFSLWPFTVFRVPSRFIWLFVISSVVIATMALDYVLNRIAFNRLRVLTGVFLISAQVLTILVVWSPYHLTEPAKEWLQNPSLREYMDSGGFTYSIGSQVGYNNVYMRGGWTLRNNEIHPSYILRNAFSPDVSPLWGVAQVHDYTGRSLKRTKVLDDLLSQSITYDSGYATISAFGEKMLSVLSVTNILSSYELTHADLKVRAKISDPNAQITLLLHPKALPKAYLVSDTMPVSTIDDSVRAFTSEKFIPGESVLVEKIIPLKHQKTLPDVNTLSSREGEYIFRVVGLKHDAVLALSETYYPGWKAFIDTSETDIFPVNVKHTGIVIPPGDHTIKFIFAPDSFRVGAYISGLTLFFMLLYVSLYRRTRNST